MWEFWGLTVAAIIAAIVPIVIYALKARSKRSARSADHDLEALNLASDKFTWMLKLSGIIGIPSQRSEAVSLAAQARNAAERILDPQLRRDMIGAIHHFEYVASSDFPYETEEAWTEANQRRAEVHDELSAILDRLYVKRQQVEASARR